MGSKMGVGTGGRSGRPEFQLCVTLGQVTSSLRPTVSSVTTNTGNRLESIQFYDGCSRETESSTLFFLRGAPIRTQRSCPVVLQHGIYSLHSLYMDDQPLPTAFKRENQILLFRYLKEKQNKTKTVQHHLPHLHAFNC